MKILRHFSLAVTFLALMVLARADEKSAIAAIEKLGGRVLYVAKDSKEYNVTITKNLFNKEQLFQIYHYIQDLYNLMLDQHLCQEFDRSIYFY